jgi:uncharacterized membrane protein
MDAASAALTFASAFFALALSGVYLAFDLLVMPALRTRPVAESVAAMQEVNRRALRPAFQVLFFASALLALAAGVTSGIAAEGAVSATRVIGNALVFLGFVITVGVNVPRNNAVAALDAVGPGTAERWRALERGWSAGNRWRFAVSLAGAAMLLSTLVALPAL